MAPGSMLAEKHAHSAGIASITHATLRNLKLDINKSKFVSVYRLDELSVQNSFVQYLSLYLFLYLCQPQTFENKNVTT